MSIESNYDSIDSEESIKSINIIKNYPKEKRYTLAILQDIQKEFNYIPRDIMVSISEYLNLPLSDIYSIATFYKSLSLKPKGKYIIKVCNGTACHIRGSNKLIEEISEMLEILPGETTEDGLFSIEIVNCLGACALAPVMVINGKYYGDMNKEKVKAVIDEYKGAI
ncbi:NADH-quinone oxidoreductase subunit E [Sedimentibacter acidaminivorans]|uniref:NADH-quinone oxidoreductase subunit E n=1 Tax=Sedimentibacter acidaminivorans TaxID=913099 RepID=A0ABS4GEV9_9FIRM|nr:NADH-quinone oxidoreductase subunit NuoE [Sedimentibacter acidaminivorans]MBP1926177.1 NADH-quinone oxidoreductase subunit E [Sedimentibacter acidaminivorans]